MEVSGKRQNSSTKDNAGKSSDGVGKISCQPCSSDGDMVVATGYCQNCDEYLCAVCLKVHRKQAISRNHNVVDGDNMPKVTSQSFSLSACSDECQKHVNEIIKYYCSSHDVVGCGDCMIIGHKSCKVDRIQDISTEYFNGAEHQSIVKKVQLFEESIEKVKEDIEASEKKMKQAYEKVVNDVQTFKKEIIDYLDKAEKKMLDMIANSEQRDKSLIIKLKQEEKRIADDINEIHTKLQLQQNQANKLFADAKQVKAKLCSIGENLDKLNKDVNIDLYEFRRSSFIGQINDSTFKLGDLSVIVGDTGIMAGHGTLNEEYVTRIAEQDIVEQKDISEMDADFDHEINIKLQDDASDCFVYDVSLMSEHQLIVADYANTCFKLVDMKNKCVSKYKLRSNPYGLAVVNPNLIAVTFLDKGKIKFFAITVGNKISEKDMIKIDKGCKKITICENKIIGITNDSVEIMSMSGQKIQSITHPKLTLLMDIAVVPSLQLLYVSNSIYNNAGVHMLDFYGNLKATYQHKELVDVIGLEDTRYGTLLACNWAENGSIHMITPACKNIKELLRQNEHVNYPRCVAFCNETNKLFIANNEVSLDSKMKNVLKVFQLR